MTGHLPIEALCLRVEAVRPSLINKSKAERDPGPIAAPPLNVMQINRDPWPEVDRGVPNAALRSALFGVIKKGARAYLERQEIHAQEGICIIYTGARLDQGDLDAWLTVLHIARTQELGDECRVTAYQLLKALGKTDTGSNRDTLERRLSRMKATGVDVNVGKYGYEGSLIDEVYREKETREYVIRLNPKLCALFEADQFTQIDWSVRHALDGKPLAQWLHGYYSSHARPFPVKVDTLHRLCGSEAALLSDFKKDLRKALDAVADAGTANGQPFSYDIRGDLVHVKKQASESQQRHLAYRRSAPGIPSQRPRNTVAAPPEYRRSTPGVPSQHPRNQQA
jgi:hypothetical protein